MVQDYWGWSEGSRTVEDGLNISYLYSYSYSYLYSRTGRWEIYLVSEEYGGRWWESGKILLLFLYLYLYSRTGRWEIYLVSEEYGGRCRESGKKINYFYICFWINGWRRQGK